jgi:hypothetical protein
MKMKIHIRHAPHALLVGLVLLLISVAGVLASGNIDQTQRWAWGINVGWISFELGDDGGVTVYSDHLEGYAWGENVGWIRLGSCTGGSPCSHANDGAGTYGVNNDGVGNLTGYAWGINVGWIDFNPTGGGVTIDPVTGDFAGYAWGENVGWINFQNDSPAYKVNTTWRGNLASAYQNDIDAIITTRRPGPAASSGLTIANISFLNDPGDGIIFGHNASIFATVTSDLPGGVDKRWARVWQLDVCDEESDGGQVLLTFDISDAGGQGAFSTTGTYFLLKRATGSNDTFAIVTVGSASVSGDQLTFAVDVGELGSEFTLGATADSPTVVTLQNRTTQAGWSVPGAVLLSLFALMAIVLMAMRRRI